MKVEKIKKLKEKGKVKPLIKTLTDKDNNIRIAAIKALGEIGDNQAVIPLIAALNDENERIRKHVIKSLGESKDNRAVEPLINYMNKEWRKELIILAIDALGSLGSKKAIDALVNMVVSINPDIRIASARALSLLGDSRWKNSLTKTNIIIGLECDFISIGKLGDKKMLAPLVNKIGSASYSKEYNLIYEGIEMLADYEDVGFFLNKLSDERKSVRKASIEILGSMKIDKAVIPIIEKLKDNDAGVRSKAVEALLKFEDNRAVVPLIDILHDKNLDVRKKTAKVLGEFGDKQAVEPLLKCLQDRNNDEYVRSEVAIALGKIGDKRATEKLFKCLINENVGDILRGASAKALGALGEMKAYRLFCDYVCDEKNEEYFRSSCAIALGKLGDKNAINLLIESLLYNSKGIREAAAEALSMLGETQWRYLINDKDYLIRLSETKDKRLFLPLKKLLDDMTVTEVTKNYTILALGVLGDKRAVPSLIFWLNEKLGTQMNAVQALSDLGDNSAMDALIAYFKKCNKNNWELGRQFVKALGNIKDGKAQMYLVECLEDKNWNYRIRSEAAIALGKFKDEKNIPILVKCLEDKYADIRINSVFAIAEIGKTKDIKEAFEPILQFMNGELGYTGISASSTPWDIEMQIRYYYKRKGEAIITALYNSGDKRAIPIFIDELENEIGSVRKQAAIALLELQKKNKNIVYLTDDIIKKIQRSHIDDSHGKDADNGCTSKYIHKDIGIGVETKDF